VRDSIDTALEKYYKSGESNVFTDFKKGLIEKLYKDPLTATLSKKYLPILQSGLAEINKLEEKGYTLLA